MKVAANLSLMFAEAGGILNRYKAAAEAGFTCVEIQYPYEESAAALAAALKTNNLTQVAINSPPGRIETGAKGLACIPAAEADFQKSIQTAIDYAKALRCTKVHVLAGFTPADTLRISAEECYVRNIKYAANQFLPEGITVLIEPVNRYSLPDYFVNSFEQAVGYIERIGMPNVKLLLDVFHCQLIHGQLTHTITQTWKHIGHIQVAQADRRHEPSSAGEINYPFIFDFLREKGYDGYIGAEYVPSTDMTVQSLGWIKDMHLEM